MLKHEDNLTFPVAGSSGNYLAPLSGATVTVTVSQTGALASLFSDNGVTAKPNPTTTNPLGYYSFYAADDTYTLTFTGPNFTTVTRSLVLENMADGVSSFAAPAGSALVGYLPPGTGAVATQVQAKLREVVSVTDFMSPTLRATVAAGTGGDTLAAWTAALAALPVAGGGIIVPNGMYDFSADFIINKPLRLITTGNRSGGVTFRTNSATAPILNATGVSGLDLSGFNMTSSVLRTAGPFIRINTCNRVKITNFFSDSHYVCVSLNGGSEIEVDDFSIFNGVANSVVAGGGGIVVGGSLYTGSVSIGARSGYIKCASALLQAAYGIRLQYVDGVALGAGLAIIWSGNALEITPGSGLTASLIKSYGGIFDTSVNGVSISPTGTGRVIRCDFYGGWYGQNTSSGIVIDGTTGTVDGVEFHGGDVMNNTTAGLNLVGANAKNLRPSRLRIAGNGIGVRAVSASNFVLDECTIGTIGAASVNAVGVATDGTCTGSMSRNLFNANTVQVSGSTSMLTMEDNAGIDNWVAFTPTLTTTVGTLTAASATCRYLRRGQMITFEMTILITTNGTGAAVLNATLPVTTRTAFCGSGRGAGVSGKQIQAYSPNSGTTVAVLNYDGTYPGANGELIVISGTYEIL